MSAAAAAKGTAAKAPSALYAAKIMGQEVKESAKNVISALASPPPSDWIYLLNRVVRATRTGGPRKHHSVANRPCVPQKTVRGLSNDCLKRRQRL